jgi:hypothetical protein
MDDEITPMTDEEADLFRRLRFAQLPPVVAPSEMTTSTDTRAVQPPDANAEWRRQYDGQV